MAEPLIPKAALAYIKNKKLQPGFSYKDIWNEEHATMFTVAKAMQLDVLNDIKTAVEQALEKGETLESFRKNLRPTLQAKGWWGKKEMVDPLTGKTVDAQLGSDRRLKTIYDTNLRSAYQLQQWQSAQASTSHPYLMYRVGNSQRHRKEHLAWNGLVLPKDDPWWNDHFPPKEYNCKCWTMALTEERKQRLEKTGIQVPPAIDGTPGYTVPVQTKAPPPRYTTYYNERRGILEKLPAGVGPGFNWNVGQGGRKGAILSGVVRKTQKTVPGQYDTIMKSLMANTAARDEYHNFITKTFNTIKDGKIDDRNAVSVGFLDQKILKALRGKGKDFEENSLIFLEAELLSNAKFQGRHARQGNAPAREDWYQLIDYLIDAGVFLDGNGLIFLLKRSESKYLKIVVDLSFRHKAHKGSKLLLPKVDTMYELDIAAETDRGIEEYNRIMKLEKLR
ncbi:MAG: minor capsid protein [Treponema sp.]|jgi:SPP1 gp7 family putative phage head morphogenesis protein|nr:minor capsid protein [Treponema sp.]